MNDARTFMRLLLRNDVLAFPVDEIKRKLFHFLSLGYIVAYWFLPAWFVLGGMGIVILIAVAIEVVRLNNRGFNQWILHLLGGVHRPEEEHRVSGLPWTLSGSFFTMLLFPDRIVVLVSLLYLALGDAFAALIGRRIGRRVIFNKKSLEGSMACFLICLLIGVIFLPWPVALFGALAATLIELIPWPLNDNFWIPLAAASVLATLLSFYR